MLRELRLQTDARVVVGPELLDDAAIFRMSDDLALVQTVDFLTPIVDDARTFGRIAAANALSDVYAMAGDPITALNIVCFPSTGQPPNSSRSFAAARRWYRRRVRSW